MLNACHGHLISAKSGVQDLRHPIHVTDTGGCFETAAQESQEARSMKAASLRHETLPSPAKPQRVSPNDQGKFSCFSRQVPGSAFLVNIVPSNLL